MHGIHRLRRDIIETRHYRMRLIKKGKEVLAYKMAKKVLYMEKNLQDLERVYMGR